MEFCEICDNLLYLRADDDTTLSKYCKHCNTSKIADAMAMKVSETLYSEDDLLYLQYKNKFLRCDPTLPRISDPNMPCPNGDCTAPKDKPQILYVKYHAVHMKFLYCCEYCGMIWRNTTDTDHA